MPNPLLLFLFLLSLTSPLVSANRDTINDKYTQSCTGMYAKSSWGGSISPFILPTLKQSSSDDELISVVIFEYSDIDVLGKLQADGNKKYICDNNAVDLKLCDEDQLGNFIIDSENFNQNKSLIQTYHINKDSDTKYPVKATGYYCVAGYSKNSDATYKIEINFQNSFGQLSAAEYPKLPLYAILAILYAITGAYYGYNYYRHRHEILPLQKYFLFFSVFLTLETIFIWSYYDLINVKGASNLGVKFYMVFISILNAFRFSFSFFLLLIISLGYGIVYPKLDRKLMLKSQIFTAIHFVSAIIYIIFNYVSTLSNETSQAAGFSSIPVMLLTVAFYVITLKSLSQTTALLATQKQVIKLKMYRRLFRILFFSLLILILGIFISSFIYIGMSTIELIEQHWKTRFFYLEFWPSLVYFVIFNLIAFIWRPTDTSYMLAASSQLPTDPENAADFELDDLQSLQENNNNNNDDDDDENPFDDNNGYENINHDNDSLNLGSDDETHYDDRTEASGKWKKKD